MSRILCDLGFLLLHPTVQMLHALNSVSGSLWHFQPQPQQQGMWRSSTRGLDPALPPTRFGSSQPHVEPSWAETQLLQGAHLHHLTLLHRRILRSVETLPRWVCRARFPGQHPILLLGIAKFFISQDPRFHPNTSCCLLLWGEGAFCGRQQCCGSDFSIVSSSTDKRQMLSAIYL